MPSTTCYKEMVMQTDYSQQFPRQTTGLNLAAYFGVKLVVKQLLENGADIEVADRDG